MPESIVEKVVVSLPPAKKDERKYEHTEDGGRATIHSVSDRIRTVDEAIEFGGVDRSIWEVDRFTLNSWESACRSDETGKLERTTLWQVKVHLRRRVAKSVSDSIEHLLERFRDHKPLAPTPSRKRSAKHLLEISLFDAHFGKLAWANETGEDFDTQIAERVYHNAISDLLDRSSGSRIDRILFPVGSDFFNVDSWKLETARGTPQDSDGRFQKVFRVGCMAVVRAIDMCLNVAPVDFVWVPGNHDPSTSFYMSEFLGAWYRGNKHVRGDLSARSRKAYQYGANMIGFTHGDEEKHDLLPGLFATEYPQMWADTQCREIHLGHFHKKKEVKHVDIDEHMGTRVRVLPSLSGRDAWHYRKGYMSRRCAEAYIYHRDEGYVGHMSVNARNS